MEIASNQNRLGVVEPMVSPKKVAEQEREVGFEKHQANEVTRAEKLKENDESTKSAGNLQVAVSQINDYVQNLQRDLQFTIDDVTGKDIVTVIDSESKEVIRQLPSEEALALARHLKENRETGVQLISTQV